MSTPKKIVFVCMGNICRSPTGEGVLRKLAAERGMSDLIEIESAGTIDYHAGELPDPRMRRAAAARGYKLESRARQFKPADFDRFDLIVAMDRENQADLLALDPTGAHQHKVRLLSDFIDRPEQIDVPDPYYGGAAGFERVLDMIEEASESILDSLFEDEPQTQST